MSFLQSIWSDLVEKRLWPIALALVVALIAIPFVITGKSSTDAPLPLANTLNTATPGQLGPAALGRPQVQLLNAEQRHGQGGHRSPFTQPKIPKPVVAVVTSTTPAPAPKTGPNNGGGNDNPGPGPSTPTPFVPATPTTPKTPSTPSKPKADDTNLYQVSLRVGQAGDLQVHNDVQRLTPLPSTLDPFFVFMGVMSDGKTAVFLISSDAKATGDGVCKPSPTNCQTVEMKAQDVEFFDVAGADPTDPSTQYELDLNRIVKSHASTGAVAAAARTASAQTGQQIIDQTRASGATASADYSFSPGQGVLQRQLPPLGAVLAHVAANAGP